MEVLILAAGVGWFAVAVLADPVTLLASARVVDLDERGGRLLVAVVAGFALQVMLGALSFLLPVVWGRGAWGNRRLTRLLEMGWPLRAVALNLGVGLRAFGPSEGVAACVGWWLIGLAVASFVLLAGMALVWRVATVPDPAGHAR